MATILTGSNGDRAVIDDDGGSTALRMVGSGPEQCPNCHKAAGKCICIRGCSARLRSSRSGTVSAMRRCPRGRGGIANDGPSDCRDTEAATRFRRGLRAWLLLRLGELALLVGRLRLKSRRDGRCSSRPFNSVHPPLRKELKPWGTIRPLSGRHKRASFPQDAGTFRTENKSAAFSALDLTLVNAAPIGDDRCSIFSRATMCRVRSAPWP